MRLLTADNVYGTGTLVDAEVIHLPIGPAFVHYNNNEWYCCDFETGICIGSSIQGRDIAIQFANNRIQNYGVDKILERLKEFKKVNKPYFSSMKREPKAGDWVILTKSDRNWCSSEEPFEMSMDRCVGMKVRIKSIELSWRRARGVTKFFETGDPDIDNLLNTQYYWCYHDGHFRIIAYDEEARKPKTRELVFSGSFRDFLKSIRKESKIAKVILACMELQEQRGGWVANYVLTGEDVSYITYRTDGNISYLPKGREHKLTSDKKWARDGRQDGKPAKVIRRIFTPKAQAMFKATDYEYFNNRYRGRFSTDGFEFSILDRTQIGEVYDMRLWSDESSECDDSALHRSCMSGCGEYMDIYENCEKVSILTLIHKESENLAGRALVWKATRRDNGEEITFMDRIYAAKEHMYEMFIDYAVNKDWYYKKNYRSYDEKTWLVRPDGELEFIKMIVKTDTDFDTYPYIDTFSYGNDGELTNYSAHYTYNDTGGARGPQEDDHEGQEYDERLGEWFDDDEVVFVSRGQWRDNYLFHRDVCTIHGETWWIDDEDICYCSYLSEHRLREDTVYSDYGDDYILIDDAVEIGEDWYLKDSKRANELLAQQATPQIEIVYTEPVTQTTNEQA